MLDFLKQEIGFLLATVGGLIVSVISSDQHSFMIAVSRVLAGLFCATVLVNPFLDIMSLDPEIYRNGVAGLFAMIGHSTARFLANIDLKIVADYFLGRKK